MENWGWSEGKSADQLADYMSYALRILKNVGLTCEGITTPGGFGIRVLPELAQATLQSCRDVFRAEIPHYFRHAFTDEQSVAPRVEYASGLDGPDPQMRRLDHRLHRRLVRRLGRTDSRLGRPVHHRRPQGRPAAGGHRPRRAGRHGLPLAGDLFQRPGDRLQDLPGSRAAAARRVRQPDLDEAERDRPLLGRPRADPDRTHRARTGSTSTPRLRVPSSRFKIPMSSQRLGAGSGAAASSLRLSSGPVTTPLKPSRRPSRSSRGCTMAGDELLVCFDLPHSASRWGSIGAEEGGHGMTDGKQAARGFQAGPVAETGAGAGRSADDGHGREHARAIQARKRIRAAANRFRWKLQLMLAPSEVIADSRFSSCLGSQGGSEVEDVVEIGTRIGGGLFQVAGDDQVVDDVADVRRRWIPH